MLSKFEDLLFNSLDRAVDGFVSPLFYISDPSRRVFWLFLLSSLVLAAVAYFFSYRQQLSVRSAVYRVFSVRYWFNYSTSVDAYYLVLNSVLKAVILLPLFGSHLWATIIVARFFQGNFGNAPEIALPLWAVMLSFTAIFFVFEDLSRFLVHFCFHKIPWLWHFHKLHHSATTLTPVTVHRVHPVEMFAYFLRGLLVFGLLSGVFVYFFGSRLSGLQILGVDALGFLFNLFGANLRHSHIWLSFGFFEKWFVSPAQHQIHHSVQKEHHDKNLGTCLALWDRLAGTWVGAGHKPKLIKYGI